MKNVLKLAMFALVLFSVSTYAQLPSQTETINTTSQTRVTLTTTPNMLGGRLVGSDGNVSYSIVNKSKGHIDFTITDSKSGSVDYLYQKRAFEQDTWIDHMDLTINYDTTCDVVISAPSSMNVDYPGDTSATITTSGSCVSDGFEIENAWVRSGAYAFINGSTFTINVSSGHPGGTAVYKIRGSNGGTKGAWKSVTVYFGNNI